MTNLCELPTELLLDIFFELDYVTLNLNVQRVCKRFRDLIYFERHATLAKNLFLRADCDYNEFFTELQEVDETTTEFLFDVHPCIERLIAKCEIREQKHLFIEDVGFRSKSGEFFSISSTKLLDEQAFSPGIPAKEFWPNQRAQNPPSMMLFYMIDGMNRDVRVKELVEMIWKYHIDPGRGISEDFAKTILEAEGFYPLVKLRGWFYWFALRRFEEQDYNALSLPLFKSTDTNANTSSPELLSRVE